jgi:hypothetical protein
VLRQRRLDPGLGTPLPVTDILDRLPPHGAELVGELVRYENSYRLCYLRGPAAIIVALAEQIK